MTTTSSAATEITTFVDDNGSKSKKSILFKFGELVWRAKRYKLAHSKTEVTGAHE